MIFSLSFCFAGESVAMIKFAKGTVHVKSDDKLISVKEGHGLKEKDIIITGKKSEVGVAFKDGSTLTLDENSYIVVESFVFNPLEEEFNFSLDLKKGKTIFQSGKIGKLSPESFSMKIPQGIIGIRGTKFLVEVK